ncbi:MAG: hypothetical protein GX592_03340 [Clostridiales bacterium]|nr:hypothetical protein [Clostridiales bacterium]
MNRCKNNSGRGKNRYARPVGIVMMLAGVLLLMLCVPYWLWTSVLAILLISVGFLLWRFS